MKKCCISLGVNSRQPKNNPQLISQDFSSGLRRIKDGVEKFSTGIDTILWDNDYPLGSPRQEDAHGGFKPFCFEEAYKLGYELIMWIDASILIKKPIDILFNMIEEEGYLFFKEDHSVGQYCKDEALITLNLDRETSFLLPCCWSCVVGLNMRHENSKIFLEEWKNKALDGISFTGPKWSGVYGWPKIASKDDRVNGHRYDQTVASVLAIRLGMTNWQSKNFFYDFFDNKRDSVRVYKEWYNQEN